MRVFVCKLLKWKTVRNNHEKLLKSHLGPGYWKENRLPQFSQFFLDAPSSISQCLHWDMFLKVSYTCVQMHVHCVILVQQVFSHRDVRFAELTHGFPPLSLSLFGVLMWRLVLKGLCCHFLFRLKHGNHPVKITVTVCGKFHRSFPRSYNLEVLCTYGCACAVRVCECEMGIAAERQPGSDRALKLCFLRDSVFLF